MNGEYVDERVEERATTAEPGRDEVSLILMHGSPHGRAMWEEGFGNPEWPRAYEGEGPAILVRVEASPGRARELLMRYGGRAGAAIATTLLQTGRGDQRFVGLYAGEIGLLGWISGGDTFRQTEALDASGGSPRGPFVFEMPLHDGGTATSAVPTFLDGLVVRGLVRAADEATTPAGDAGRDGQALAEDCLASLLLEAFARQPDNAVRAAEALWWSGRRGKCSVMRVLWSRPELRALAERVQQAVLGG